jgi:hypothetical protein
MTRPTLLVALAAALLVAAFAIPAAHGQTGVPGVVDPTVPADRSADAVVLTGKDLLAGSATWAVPENLTLAVPSKDVTCFAQSQGSTCPDQFNHYVAPDADTAPTESQLGVEGTPTNLIRGYRWNGKKFEEIRFQVDEMFTRYLNNDASGFGIYSGTDQHNTYAFDVEPFRRTANDPNNPCDSALPAGQPVTTPDPVKGLDSNDELAFMATDAGPQAPSGATLPHGVVGAKVVTIADPTNPNAQPSYVYIGRVDAGFAQKNPSAFADPKTWYVHYADDPDSRRLAYSKSSNGSYGPAVEGPYCPEGSDQPTAKGPRRELDTATVTTRRYLFHYGGEPGIDTGKSGRWLMTSIQIKQPNGKWGPDLVDRWKARAFAQDSASNTPCCGYEEEDTNWGGSSNLLGEKVGPVRAIRETWGADSGTNVIRRETFYRDSMIQKSYLRVHVIPPLDGIYAQWDFNAGRVDRFYNSQHPGGVAIDGKNDEVYGNFDDPCEDRWSNDPSRSQVDSAYRQLYIGLQGCTIAKTASDSDPSGQVDYYHQSVDPGDATFDDANSSLGWSEVDGPFGTIVDRIHAQPQDLTPGGLAQSLAAVPYYRDDACFDDGTGSDPGIERFPRHPDQETQPLPDGTQRKCWTSGKDAQYPGGDPAYYQGDIGTHGLHLLFQAESDNARTTEPIDQIVSDWDMKFLPPRTAKGGATVPNGNIGEAEGRPLEKPLVAVVADAPQPTAPAQGKG